MTDPDVGMVAGVEASEEQLGRNSPASPVCNRNVAEAYESAANTFDASSTVEHEPARGEGEQAEHFAATLAREDSDSTPRSEVPSVLDPATLESHNLVHDSQSSEPGYFSPQPLRVYSTKLSTSAANSADPSPTTSLNASTTSVYIPHQNNNDITEKPATPADALDRPSVHRDHSSASSASGHTIRPVSTDPIPSFLPGSRTQRDGPHYPNQSYAALHSQHYPPPYTPHILRTRSSHPSHYPSYSAAHISTFGTGLEHHNIMESGSRTVGNSPASSPGLFSPTTPPLRHTQRTPDDQGYYSSPYLHHTHRQMPKETHVADVDVDPISGRKIINQYEVIDELGRGVHGKVKLGRNLETHEHVAIKIVDRYSKRRRLGKNTSHEDKIKKEIAILKKARHPHIVSLIEVIDDPSRKKVYIVLEHVELGEVRWRTEGAKEVTLVEWRRHQRESEGVFDNENAAMEDERIIEMAHRRLDLQQRRRLRDNRRQNMPEVESWSFEHGGDSESEASDNGRNSRASNVEDRHRSHRSFADRYAQQHENTMDTAIRSTTPTANSRADENSMDTTGLEGTMYGPYDTEPIRGRTPSLTGSSSSRFCNSEENIPEHFRYVPTMTIGDARNAFRDTVLGLEYLHYQGVIHRDIKPANLLLTKSHQIKISDFGVSYLGRQSSEESHGDQSESDAHDADEAIELAKTVGTPAFYAPELCRTDLDDDAPPVTGKIDVWALGVTLYCLVFGRVPFHEGTPYALMKAIAETEPYIPRFRLKPVSEKPESRPSSHGRLYHSMTTSKRAPHDLEYEEVDDDLYDLLNKLLVKDPRKRIGIKEIKTHDWLLAGIEDSGTWVEQTDPTKSLSGQKIEISRDDVEKAVVPITLIDRVRSGVKKTLDTVLRMGTRGGSRRRAQSSATNQDSQTISATSSSSTISQDGRRPSLAGAFQGALIQSRPDPEHPLSQSLTASPEAREHPNYIEKPRSRPGSPAYSVESAENPAALNASLRPNTLERSQSTMSSAASVRTIRQSDLALAGHVPSPILPPALPGTPTALDSPGSTNLGGIFGGVPRRLINNARSRERMLKPPSEHGRSKSIDRLVITDDDAHSLASLAVSNTTVIGHLDQPDILKDSSPVAGNMSSWSDHRYPDPILRASSRQSSVSSASSRYNSVYIPHSEAEVGPIASAYPFPSLQRETSDDRFNRAKDDLIRRRIQEENQGRERPHSSTFQRPNSLSLAPCPPSPDDEIFATRQNYEELFNQQGGHHDFTEASPHSYALSMNSQHSRALTSSSSEDHITSMSQSTSNPSIPSVISANSSVAPEDCLFMDRVHQAAAGSSDNVTDPLNTAIEDHSGYEGDHPLESDDDDSSDDDDDDFIVMAKKKSNIQSAARSGSISNAELARHSVRREIISNRRRSDRSGSNGTVKKIKPLEDHDDDRAEKPI